MEPFHSATESRLSGGCAPFAVFLFGCPPPAVAVRGTLGLIPGIGPWGLHWV